MRPGQYAAVIGDGLVGQWTAQTLAYRQAKVIMIGMDRFRLNLAQKILNCPTIDIQTTDWTQAVRQIAPEGLAIAADVVGSRDMTEKVIPLMKRTGHIVSAGFCGTDDQISLQALRDRELSLDSVSSATPQRMQKTRDLIAAGHLKTLPLITHHYPRRTSRPSMGHHPQGSTATRTRSDPRLVTNNDNSVRQTNSAPRIAAFPKCFINDIGPGMAHSLFDWIEMSTTLNVEGLELYPSFFESYRLDYLHQVRSAVESKGMSIPMFCSSPDLSHPDPDALNRQMDLQRQNIQAAAVLGCQTCRVLSGQKTPATCPPSEESNKSSPASTPYYPSPAHSA